MVHYGWPILYALFVWWFSTVAILYLDGLPKRTFAWTVGGATALAAASFYAVFTVGSDTSTVAAYAGFTGGLVIWGWLEVGFYTGILAGPRKQAEEGTTGWRHFVHATETTLYHELASLVVACLLFAMARHQPNQVGCWTFVALWLMQISAKLNVFFGVRNLNEEFLPAHLNFLSAYLTKKPMNMLFPVSVTLSSLAAVLLINQASVSDGFAAITASFLSTMMVLAVIEHWLLVLPLPTAALWSWGLKSHAPLPVELPDNVEPLWSADRTRHPLKTTSPVLLTLENGITLMPKH
jgi:putative photosynthetic complex assembly protein 2